MTELTDSVYLLVEGNGEKMTILSVFTGAGTAVLTSDALPVTEADASVSSGVTFTFMGALYGICVTSSTS